MRASWRWPRPLFYLQSGGQVSGRGAHSAATAARRAVTDVVKGPADVPRFHAVKVTRGALGYGDTVTAEVDTAARDATQAQPHRDASPARALRQVLGPHVKQAGIARAPRTGCGSILPTSAP